MQRLSVAILAQAGPAGQQREVQFLPLLQRFDVFGWGFSRRWAVFGWGWAFVRRLYGDLQRDSVDEGKGSNRQWRCVHGQQHCWGSFPVRVHAVHEDGVGAGSTTT